MSKEVPRSHRAHHDRANCTLSSALMIRGPTDLAEPHEQMRYSRLFREPSPRLGRPLIRRARYVLTFHLHSPRCEVFFSTLSIFSPRRHEPFMVLSRPHLCRLSTSSSGRSVLEPRGLPSGTTRRPAEQIQAGPGLERRPCMLMASSGHCHGGFRSSMPGCHYTGLYWLSSKSGSHHVGT